MFSRILRIREIHVKHFKENMPYYTIFFRIPLLNFIFLVFIALFRLTAVNRTRIFSALIHNSCVPYTEYGFYIYIYILYVVLCSFTEYVQRYKLLTCYGRLFKFWNYHTELSSNLKMCKTKLNSTKYNWIIKVMRKRKRKTIMFHCFSTGFTRVSDLFEKQIKFFPSV